MINVYCFCFGFLGVQQHGRYFVRSLGRYDSIALFPWDDLPDEQLLSPFVRQALDNASGDAAENPAVGIGVMNRMGLLRGAHRVAYTIWETTRIPEQEIRQLDDVDEIWIPSTWGRQILASNGISGDRIRVVPEGVDTTRFKPVDRDHNAGADRPFRFLCVGKWERRKGIDVLLEAYRRAFLPGEKVELVLHCHNPAIHGFNIKRAIATLKLPAHAPIIESYPLPEARMNELYNSCDAFVLPSRGEGWGLPVIEAMACAKPVIVTNYSAYLDYVNTDNAYLIDVERMVDVDDPLHFDPGLDYGQWAEPDVEHLAHLMREVYLNRQEATWKGSKAKQQVADNWTWGQSARLAWEHLREHVGS